MSRNVGFLAKKGAAAAAEGLAAGEVWDLSGAGRKDSSSSSCSEQSWVMGFL